MLHPKSRTIVCDTSSTILVYATRHTSTTVPLTSALCQPLRPLPTTAPLLAAGVPALLFRCRIKDGVGTRITPFALQMLARCINTVQTSPPASFDAVCIRAVDEQEIAG